MDDLKRPKGIKPAKDILATFLASNKSFTLPIFPGKTPKHPIHQLNCEYAQVYRYMFDVMDFNSFDKKLGFQQICNKSNSMIAKYARVCKNTVKRAKDYGEIVGILKPIFKKDRCVDVYTIGELFNK